MTAAIGVLDPLATAIRVAGLAALAGGVVIAIAVVFRWYARDRVPQGVTLLAGLGIVAVYLNTTVALGQVIGGSVGLLELDAALINTIAFAVAAGAAIVGRRVGDRTAVEIGAISGARELDVEVGRLVQTVGRVTAVTLPEAEDIEAIEGYDPVPDSTVDALAGKTLLFPRNLTVDALQTRLIDRLKADYGVGHVGVELDEHGRVDYLSLGSRAAGLGPTLPPGTAATAVWADPPNAATSGDTVQVWTTPVGAAPRRVATGELRAAVGDVVTLALDAPDATGLDPTLRYRLLTLPAESRPEREFAGLLRAADETMGVITVGVGSAVVGRSVGDVEPTIVAIRGDDGSIEAIPPRGRQLAVGDVVYAIARPEVLRRLEVDAAAPEAEPSSDPARTP